MADSIYPGAEDDEASPSETPESSDNPKDGKEDGETALLPKSLFGGASPKPGEEYVFEVVRGYEDEIEIKYAPKKKEEPDADDADSKISAMGKEMGGG